ncbi:MAG TPA: hypothetical protein VF634_14060, partial [Pyrinomonadaceae bacterium]
RIRFGLPQLAPRATPAQLRQPVPFSTASLTVFDPSTRSPKTNQWGLSVQREIGRGFVAEVNYIGRRAVGLYGAYDANQVNVFARDPRFNESYLEAFNTLRANSTATSPLINALLTGNPATNAGSAQFRTLFTTALAQGSIAATAISLSQRTVNGRRVVADNGFPFFFQPFPQFTGALNVIDTNDYSTYHGLETQITRRTGRGLLLQASYTFAKSLDTRSFDPAFTIAGRTTSGTNASPAAANTPLDNRDRSLNYARSDFDRRHALQGYVVYDLPFGRGKRFLGDAPGVVNQLVGGWELASSFILQSGRPFTVYSRIFSVSNAVLSPASCNGCTPDMAGLVQETGGTYFIFSAEERARFFDPAPGQLGNTGRNAFTGPRYFNMDLAVRKRFYFGEVRNLEFRADISNLTNTPSFDHPLASTSSIASGTFGRIRPTSSGEISSSSRRIQLGLKFNF